MKIPKYYCRICREFKKRSEVCSARGYRDKRCGRCGQVVVESIRMLQSVIDVVDNSYVEVIKDLKDIKGKMGEIKTNVGHQSDLDKLGDQIEKTRKRYLYAKNRGDDDTEYWHGALRGLLDASYIVGLGEAWETKE